MFKNINQTILLRYPLLWNMRILQVFLFAIILHSVFFFFGYNSFHDISEIMDYSEWTKEISVYLLAGLILILGLILWLLYYLRNNAFKSFYPVKKNSLKKEFLLTFVCFLVTLPVFHTYQYAYHLRLMSETRDLNPEEDRNKLWLGTYFIPTDFESYENTKSCDSVRKNLDYALSQPVSTDSCDIPIRHSEQISEYNQTVTPAEKKYSYLNFCSYNLGDPNWRTNSDRVKRWLISKQKDSVYKCLKEYFAVMNAYHAFYNISIDSLVDLCFKGDSFPVTRIFYDNEYDNEISGGVYGEGEGGAFSKVVFGNLELISAKKQTFFSFFQWNVYFYISFSLAFILFLFRITRLKPWLSSLIGGGIWIIIVAIITNLSSDKIVPYLSIALILTWLLIAIKDIRSGRNKFRAALCLNWFALSFMILIPFALVIFSEHTGEIRECINHVYVIVRPEHPFRAWIQSNWELIAWINLILALPTVLYLIIPLAYRWQANPNE